ncbi:hypothetical protein KHA94_02155 [Bacillus sp. FJAT-49705]|uniref:Abortive phage infection protein n=1 Tax=Cytobacillus citreus TaxID=2833586 RepID=A0ABS5NPF9_9BACI|nr:hypothetical protein [Cytobacillus citreus]MBS4189018.1 hypothetical protein [Cytobacillus citreus]
MEEEHIQEILEKLKSGELTEYYVTKLDFFQIRSVIVKRSDFRYFRGIAQRGGDIIYQYLENPRS